MELQRVVTIKGFDLEAYAKDYGVTEEEAADMIWGDLCEAVKARYDHEGYDTDSVDSSPYVNRQSVPTLVWCEARNETRGHVGVKAHYFGPDCKRPFPATGGHGDPAPFVRCTTPDHAVGAWHSLAVDCRSPLYRTQPV